MSIKPGQLKQHTDNFKAEVIEAFSLPRSNALYDELANILRVEYFGEAILEESDLLPPEEANFKQGFAWVAPLIEKVYILGLIDGEQIGIENFRKSFENLKKVLKDPEVNQSL